MTSFEALRECHFVILSKMCLRLRPCAYLGGQIVLFPFPPIKNEGYLLKSVLLYKKKWAQTIAKYCQEKYRNKKTKTWQQNLESTG